MSEANEDLRKSFKLAEKLIYIRVRPSVDSAYSQLSLPFTISNYQSFIENLCQSLSLSAEDIQRVILMPDILVKTADDISRLKSQDRLEVHLRPPPTKSERVLTHITPKRIMTAILIFTLIVLQWKIVSKLDGVQQQIRLRDSVVLGIGEQLSVITRKLQDSRITEDIEQIKEMLFELANTETPVKHARQTSAPPAASAKKQQKLTDKT